MHKRPNIYVDKCEHSFRQQLNFRSDEMIFVVKVQTFLTTIESVLHLKVFDATCDQSSNGFLNTYEQNLCGIGIHRKHFSFIYNSQTL